MSHVAWRPGIGDPNLAGWVIFLAYFGAAAACYRASRVSTAAAGQLGGAASLGARDERRLAVFWLALCLAMSVLGLNKQLDLQTLIIQVGKQLALAQGWYDTRRSVQAAVVAALALGGGMLAVTLTYVMRSSLSRVALSLAGVAVLAAFVVLRAAQLEHMSAPHAGHRLRSLLELCGIALVGLGAHRAVRGRGVRQ
ncbi:MAG: hypothetical protein ACHQ53_05850 [Polyangiales bacterium]